MKPLFPKDFLWGASTASHQVEGGTHNQWSVWELEHANELAKTAKRRLGWMPSWEDIRAQAEDPNNYVSGRGVDHYNRYEEDFDLIEKLNLNSFRFGIEWSRLQPSKDAWDPGAIAHYREYIQALKKRGIEPILNLWHWTVPVWFDELGGFEKTSNLRYWDEFVARVGKEFGKDITYIITINEPNVFASFGYLMGEWPPQKKSWSTFVLVYWNLAIAHRHAYRILKRQKKSFKIGIATQLANIQAKRPHKRLDVFMTRWMRYFWNWWFLNRIKRQQDFVGFNYYFTDYYQGPKRENPQSPVNDLGWYMEPEGLYPLIVRVWARYKKPIIITENGVADHKDQYRRWWLEESLIALQRAISEGAEVHGYLHWSLLDNFEWKYGWWPKFGLIEVDRAHGMERKVRPSALWLSEKIRTLRGLDR